jgi:signal transduction histidine kinase
MSALTGGLAHEIRNPLSTLKVNLQLLDEDWRRIENQESGQAGDAQEIARRSRRRIATLLAESLRLEQILQDFLTYVGKYELKRVPADLNEIARELADFYQPQAQAGGVELRLNVSGSSVICDVDVNRHRRASQSAHQRPASRKAGGSSSRRAGWCPTARIDDAGYRAGIPQDRKTWSRILL